MEGPCTAVGGGGGSSHVLSMALGAWGMSSQTLSQVSEPG